MHPAFSQTGHRPWPMPTTAWTWQQAWCDLVFIHYEVNAVELRRHVPAWLELDEFAGKAWIGIVPFRMVGVTRRGWPAPQALCDFPEINVRTYVTCQNQPGVWFLSLDATTQLGVWFAKTFFYLPYYYAPIRMTDVNGRVDYSAQRGSREFAASYSTTSEFVAARPGDFTHWATERYCLYSESGNGKRYRAEVQHPKWSLQRAQLQISQNNLSPVSLGAMHPLVLFSRRLDVAIWPLEQID